MRKNLISQLAVTLVILAAPAVANATVVVSTGNNGTAISTLTSGVGLDGGATAALAGGAVYTSNALPNAAIPDPGTVGNWLAAGPGNGGDATLTLAVNTNYFSFLWGSPDPAGWNALHIQTNLGGYDFTATSAGVNPDNGNQQFAQYVQFFATGPGELITSVKFGATQNAFEVANFRVSAVPEASTWAMMILGFLGLGFFGYRRSSKTSGAAFRVA